jgi:hypothetical protein
MKREIRKKRLRERRVKKKKILYIKIKRIDWDPASGKAESQSAEREIVWVRLI